MLSINLLPWRKKQQEKNVINFFKRLGVVTSFALLFGLGCHYFLVKNIRMQDLINKKISMEIEHYSSQVKKLTQIQKEDKDLLEKLNFVDYQEKQKITGLRLINSIEKILPVGIYIKQLSRKDNQFILLGYSKKNVFINDLLVAIKQTDLLINPVLNKITFQPDSNQFSFKLIGQVRMKNS